MNKRLPRQNRPKKPHHDRRSISFIDYWDAIDAAMLKLFGIDTYVARIDVDLIASAQEECWTPEEFVRWIGKNYDRRSAMDVIS
jgi:hypothetical protein